MREMERWQKVRRSIQREALLLRQLVLPAVLDRDLHLNQLVPGRVIQKISPEMGSGDQVRNQ